MDVVPPEKSSDIEARFVFSIILSWFAGYFFGSAFRVANYVLKYEKLKENLTNQIKKLENQISNSNKKIRSTVNSSID